MIFFFFSMRGELPNTYAGDAGFGVLVCLDFFQGSISKPLFYFFDVVVIALWCREYVEGIIEFHIEREIRIVGEWEFGCEGFKPYSREEISKEIDEMYSESRDIAELEENRFRKLLQYIAKRFIEINRAGIVSPVVDPDEEFSSSLDSLRELEETLLRSGEMMEYTDRIRDIKGIEEWHVIDVGLDDTNIWDILSHLVSNFNSFAEVGAE